MGYVDARYQSTAGRGKKLRRPFRASLRTELHPPSSPGRCQPPLWPRDVCPGHRWGYLSHLVYLAFAPAFMARPLCSPSTTNRSSNLVPDLPSLNSPPGVLLLPTFLTPHRTGCWTNFIRSWITYSFLLYFRCLCNEDECVLRSS